MYDPRLGVATEDVRDVKRGKASPLLCLPPLGDQVTDHTITSTTAALRLVIDHYHYYFPLPNLT